MTNILRAALPVATMLVLPITALPAREPAQEITVVGQNDLQSWTTRIGRAIDDQMEFPRVLGRAGYDEGVVDISFKCSEDGKPSKVAVLSSSGSRRLDRAGMSAVQNVSSLHPLPPGITHDQTYRAKLLFAVDDGNGRAMKRAAALRDNANSDNMALAQRQGGTAMAAVVTLMPPGS